VEGADRVAINAANAKHKVGQQNDLMRARARRKMSNTQSVVVASIFSPMSASILTSRLYYPVWSGNLVIHRKGRCDPQLRDVCLLRSSCARTSKPYDIESRLRCLKDQSGEKKMTACCKKCEEERESAPQNTEGNRIASEAGSNKMPSCIAKGADDESDPKQEH
jgi:hypothetical protein